MSWNDIRSYIYIGDVPNMTYGKAYKCYYYDNSIVFEDDRGYRSFVKYVNFSEYFISVEEFREIKLEKIGI
jgi:hypothetical protein